MITEEQTTSAPATDPILAAADKLAVAVKTAKSALSGTTREWCTALNDAFAAAENYRQVRDEAEK
jgi:hypothetical protein